jgi:hypothetical protein
MTRLAPPAVILGILVSGIVAGLLTVGCSSNSAVGKTDAQAYSLDVAGGNGGEAGAGSDTVGSIDGAGRPLDGGPVDSASNDASGTPIDSASDDASDGPVDSPGDGVAEPAIDGATPCSASV